MLTNMRRRHRTIRLVTPLLLLAAASRMGNCFSIAHVPHRDRQKNPEAHHATRRQIVSFREPDEAPSFARHARDVSRQSFLSTVTLSIASWMSLSMDAVAADPSASLEQRDEVGESIRRAAAGLPGLGPPDVVYPSVFAGKWHAQRTIVDKDNSKKEDDLVVEYDVRFLPTDYVPAGSSTSVTYAIQDRGYNQANLETAYRATITSNNKSNTVQSYNWKASNPNDLSIVFSDGCTKQIKVTKRRTELTDSTVFSSEFQRLTQQGAVDGSLASPIPVISARRILTKWQVVDDNTLQAIELVYNIPMDGSGGLGSTGDPMSFSLQLQTPQQQTQELLLKSRLLLERIN